MRISEFLLKVVISNRLHAKSSAFISTIQLLQRICTANREFARTFSQVEMVVDRRDELIFN
jgi:hypothetical protein